MSKLQQSGKGNKLNGSGLLQCRHLLVTGCLALTMCFSSLAKQRPVDVIAVEYPPYTSDALPDNGLAFAALDDWLNTYQLRAKANFLPPARISKVLSGDTCA